MSFILTPPNLDYYGFLYRDPITGKWTVPILTFNTGFVDPLRVADPLNEDPMYREKVIENIYVRLNEKWLYSHSSFRSLYKYFNLEKSGSKGTVSLIADPDKVSEKTVSDADGKFIIQYIEKYFATKKFVSKVLKEYVNTTHVKWYDIFNNTSTLKDLFVHKLKKQIVNTIYELQTKSKA